MKVAKIGKLRQVKYRLGFLLPEPTTTVSDFNVVIFIVENVNDPLPYKHKLFDICLITDHHFSRNVDSAQHIDYQVVDEASLTLIKKLTEGLLKISKSPCALNDLSLHFGGELLIEVKFLNHQVEVVEQSLLNVHSYVIVQSWLNVIWLV